MPGLFLLSLTCSPSLHTMWAMYIVTRYVVWEVFKYFLAALAVLTLILTFGMGFKKGILDEGFPPLIMLKSMPFFLPETLGITIPVAMLYSVSSVFGRMTGSNEIVALKSLGISPMVVVWPVLALASFTSLGTIWMYEITATWCRPNFLRLAYRSIEEIAYSRLQKTSSFDCTMFHITIKQVDIRDGKRILVKPTITIKPRPGQPKVTLTAAEAELHTDWSTNQLQILCRHGEMDVDDGHMRMSFFKEQPCSVPMPEADWDRRHRDYVATKDIPDLIAELQAEIDKMRKDQESLKRLNEAKQALDGSASPEPSDPIAAQIADRQWKIYRLKTEPYRRWSNGFACLCFALIGMPVAMLWRHADGLTNFFVCFLPILSVYYPLLMLGEDLSTSGTLPPISFWMGNVILTIPAIIFLRRIIRH